MQSDGDHLMTNITPNHEQNTSAVMNWATDVVQQGTLALRATVRGMSFWSAILLPLVYLPPLPGFIAEDASLSSKEIGALIVKLQDSVDDLSIERWSYTGATT